MNYNEMLSLSGYHDGYSGDVVGDLIKDMRLRLDVDDFEVYAQGYRQGYWDQFYGKDREQEWSDWFALGYRHGYDVGAWWEDAPYLDRDSFQAYSYGYRAGFNERRTDW